jgi:hypothetical protein
VWLNLGGASNVRETIVAGTECELARPDGSRQRIRGRRQRTSVATDHFETIGAATLEAGRNAVSCRDAQACLSTPAGRVSTTATPTSEERVTAAGGRSPPASLHFPCYIEKNVLMRP